MLELQSTLLYITLFISLFFEVFLLITYLEVRDELRFEEAHMGKDVRHFPTVTIIVPCFNEESTVKGTVHSLLSLDYPQDKLSLVLVDDGSTDSTREVLRRFESHSRIKVLSKVNGGKHTALNHALKGINTDLVGCLDADSYVNSDALKKIVPYFGDETIMAVTPSIKVYEPKNMLQQVQKMEYTFGIFLRRMLSSMGALYVTPGPFSIFRRSVFSKLGDYKKAHQTEDLEMALRMQKHRYRIVNSHGAHVYTVAPSKLRPLIKQRVRWTYGFLNNAIDYRKLFFNASYGHIGVFILPVATISIFTTLYATSYLLWRGGGKITDFISRYQAVGLNWKMPEMSFDWFFLNTEVISIVTVSAFLLALYILYLAVRLSSGSNQFDKRGVPYMLVYMFVVPIILAPIWLTKALYNTVFKRGISWR